jgi:hypothetical protein
MIKFLTLRTSRLTAELGELSIATAVQLAKIPADQHEQATTFLLSHSVKVLDGEADVRLWTVQERLLAVAYYLAATLDEPNFAIGDEGAFLDYLAGEVDAVAAPVSVGEVEGDAFMLRHLSGAMAESIERLHGELDGISGRFHWLLGCLAAQLYPAANPPAETGHDGALDEVIRQRMQVFAAYPDSVFAQLLAVFYQGQQQLQHLFAVDVDESGLVVLPKPTGGAESSLFPARFPAVECLSELAWAMAR